VMLLIGMGVQQLSMSSSQIPLIKSLIRSISSTDARTFLATALAMNTTEKIRNEGSKRLHEMGFETPPEIGAIH
jgi:phosphotransferase system enzyme I (PtsI)